MSFFFLGEIILFFNFIIFCCFIFFKQINLSYVLNIKMLTLENFSIVKNFFYFCLFNLFFFSFFIFEIFDQNFFSFFFSLHTTEFINLIKILIIFFTITVIIFSLDYILKDLNFYGFEFFLILFLSVFGSLFLISSNDLITFYLSLELQSLAFYVLAAFKQSSIFSIEAGLKYFVLGSFSSGFFIFGSSLIYGVLGSYNFSDIYYILNNNFNFYFNNFFNFGLLLIFVTILFKISAVPFHVWVPDVYQGSPTIVMFFFSIIPKIVFLSFIIKIIVELFNFSPNVIVFYLISVAAISSLILGSVVSLLQKKIKRLLAYSSISNVGFLLIGPSTISLVCFTASLIYLIFYSFILVVIFFIIISIRYIHNNFKLKNINELFGFLNQNLFLSLCILINIFSLIGIPPFAGFFGKFYLFLVSLGSSLEILFLSSLYASIISAVIYLRLIRLTFFNKVTYFFSYTYDYYLLFFFLTLISLLNIFFFFNPNFIFLFIYNIILTLL